MALGADAPAIRWLLTASGARLVLFGAGIGLALSLLTNYLLAGMLFGVGSVDPVTFLGAGAVLGATAFFAAYLPARRASNVDPIVALRTD